LVIFLIFYITINFIFHILHGLNFIHLFVWILFKLF
jgi:hypothetical protein